ncbi:MAG TPA: dienelactone hydrolase family protein, partial [Blastocatellia bacterium]
MISVKAPDGGEFNAYLALPASGKGPGIVLLQEIFGVNKVMRDVADWYAARGFVVICPDLFWRQEPGIELTDQTDADWQRAFQLYQGLDEALAIDDAAAAMAVLRSHPACSGGVGAVGFCLGGKLAYLLAVRHHPDCAVGYYGVGIESALNEAKGLRTPLMLDIAGRDQYCPPEAQAQIHGAFDGNPLVTIHDYPQCDHAFSRIGGVHFDQAASELANLRTVDFFARNLTGAAAGAPPISLVDMWEEHLKYEFGTRQTEETLQTMVPDAYVNHIPVLTG